MTDTTNTPEPSMRYKPIWECDSCGAAQKHVRDALMDSKIREAVARRDAELARVTSERDAARDKHLQYGRAEKAEAERDAMRPVVEAAARLHDCMDDDTYDDLVLAIGQAVVKMRTASSLPANRHK